MYPILRLVCLTKKYKYYQYQQKPILKNVWGETIKKIGVMLALAAALFVVPAVAQNAIVGSGGVDVLGKGIFESDGDAFQFPFGADTNFDSLKVGNDKATAFGMPDGWPFAFRNGPTVATNNLEIKKNQDTGKCDCCNGGEEIGNCQDCCLNQNIEQIKVGNRDAMAFGFATATNNVKIVTNQVGNNQE
ncbi:MAG: hypothetical protein A4E48_01212 [Methanosaeta sp. PtaU1.Bin060]|jgi:hypothetical protein|nr:MAG: hypothetical protein A4E48_01212 [Methanosaeta sp. PtaU1.Bin060]